jgi:hypothetical protein
VGTEADRVAASPDDEVAFWQGFIEWWARERRGPVPARAWQALALAQARVKARQQRPFACGTDCPR